MFQQVYIQTKIQAIDFGERLITPTAHSCVDSDFFEEIRKFWYGFYNNGVWGVIFRSVDKLRNIYLKMLL